MGGQVKKNKLGEEAVNMMVSDGAILATIWTGAGLGGAPNPELFSLGQLGSDSDGAAAGLTYHLTGAAGSKAWTATGATVKNLYGGA